jgi:hypothetical protein
MRHFLGLALPVGLLTEGMETGTPAALLVAATSGTQRFGTSQRGTGPAITVTPIAVRTDGDLIPAALAQEQAGRRFTHPASAAMRDWTAQGETAMLRGSPTAHPALTKRPGGRATDPGPPLISAAGSRMAAALLDRQCAVTESNEPAIGRLSERWWFPPQVRLPHA